MALAVSPEEGAEKPECMALFFFLIAAVMTFPVLSYWLSDGDKSEKDCIQCIQEKEVLTAGEW